MIPKVEAERESSHRTMGRVVGACLRVGWTLALVGACSGGDRAPGQAGGGPDPLVQGGPGEVVSDRFHPDRQPDRSGERPPLPEPRRGGTVTVHLSSMPRHFNYMTESSANVRFLRETLHETLVLRDGNTWEYRGGLARSWETEDSVFVKGSQGVERLYGQVSEQGETVLVTPVSRHNPLSEPRSVPRAEVERIERGTVYTFHLRDGIFWHDRQPFTAEDLFFSWQCYWNPHVDCDDLRDQVTKITDAEVLDEHTIRFFYGEQYFNALQAFELLTVLPSHRYNLADPTNPDYDAGASVLGVEQGKYVREHPANLDWVGLGPYRLTERSEEFLVAERFEPYFDSERAGWVDTVRWQHIPDDAAAKTAVLNGELDYFARLSSNDYYGEFCQRSEFTDSMYAGYSWQPRITYVAWNMRRALFSDVRVRRALAHCFDWDEYIASQANGLGVRVTGTNFYLATSYDHSIEPLPFDLDRARGLLEEAGWYDRDGDGVRDKGGVAFEFEYLTNSGNRPAVAQGQILQENLAQVGVKMNIATRDFAAFIERCRAKDFDAFPLAWALDVQDDPRAYWFSHEGPPETDRGRNYPGLRDAEVDSLIRSIQRELDPEVRDELSRTLQRRIYELQPYMFGYQVPIKFCVAKRIRNFRNYCINPGYSIRDWYVVE